MASRYWYSTGNGTRPSSRLDCQKSKALLEDVNSDFRAEKIELQEDATSTSVDSYSASNCQPITDRTSPGVRVDEARNETVVSRSILYEEYWLYVTTTYDKFENVVVTARPLSSWKTCSIAVGLLIGDLHLQSTTGIPDSVKMVVPAIVKPLLAS